MTRMDMTFGQAIDAMALGMKVQREGWNGKNMFVWMEKGSAPHVIWPQTRINGVAADLFERGDDGTAVRMPYVHEDRRRFDRRRLAGLADRHAGNRLDAGMSGWIGVDLDGTLALYDGWRGIEHIGEPVRPMMERVRNWLGEGIEVRIFTARVAVPEPERTQVVSAIHAWLERQGLPALAVTNVKDFGMLELWDDRAVQIIPNTGRPVASLAGIR